MKNWRSSKRRSSAFQPSLPGLLDQLAGTARNEVRRLISPGERALRMAQMRLPVLAIVFSLFFLIIAGRLGSLALSSEGGEPPEQPTALLDAPVTGRADIVDRNGTILATSLPLFSICADGPKILDPEDAEKKLLEVLPDLDSEKLSEALHSSKRCAVIRRRLTPNQYYQINKLGIAGLQFMPEEGRSYPNGRLTAHVVGYTDIDNKGIAGIENGLNQRLSTNPSPVILSLDLRLQNILYTELQKGIHEFHALGGAGIIMDITNGEILSLVSLPDFDPQRAAEADDDAKFNRATLGVYEMGSTFKTFNTAMSLDSGLIRVNEHFDTIHPIQIAGKTIRDFHSVDRAMNVAEIFMESSNIGSARMAQRLGATRQRAFLSRLGLTEKLSLEIPEVGAPLVPSNARWGEVATMTIAFGHGLAVNAVQLVSAVCAIVNDGVAIKPTLLKTTPESMASTPQNRIISSRSSSLMRALLRLVVTHGTAKAAEAPGYVVGGKTGTADKLVGGHYSKNGRISSFVGVFPLNAPRYAVFAILDDPKGTTKTYGFATGGWTAAPVVGRIVTQAGPLLGFPPVDETKMAVIESTLMRPLGADVLDSLHIERNFHELASRESNETE